MVIYSQRLRMATLGGVSCAPASVPAKGMPMSTGAVPAARKLATAVSMVAPTAWLARQHESALRQPALPAASKPLSTVPNTIKRDAFAGISPGLQSMEPPV